MKKRKVIKRSNLKSRSPISTGIVFYLMLDKLNAREWIWGVIGLLFFIWLIAFIIDLFNTTEVDIFDND
jgi:hypothetical protein